MNILHFTANGNHAWTDLKFTDIAVTTDSYNYITGSVTKHGLFFDNTEVPLPVPLLLFVKLINMAKFYGAGFLQMKQLIPLEFSNIIALNNGDVVAYLAQKPLILFMAELFVYRQMVI